METGKSEADNQSNQVVRQQIIAQIKESENVLVAVRAQASMDELAAAVALSLMIDNLGKHAVAVYSGKIPSSLEFLNPEKVLVKSLDGLRDFVISLDKDKADHILVKKDGEMAKILITPYHTSIKQSDLTFEQGDYNVNLVLALGARSKSELDKALVSHDRILNEAPIIAITNEVAGDLGTMVLQDQDTASVSEIVANLAFAARELNPDLNVFDPTMATTILAGIIGVTNRFSNTNTTPSLLSLAAKLMVLGANQPLVIQNFVPSEGAEDAAADLMQKANAVTPDNDFIQLHEDGDDVGRKSREKEAGKDDESEAGGGDEMPAPMPVPVVEPNEDFGLKDIYDAPATETKTAPTEGPETTVSGDSEVPEMSGVATETAPAEGEVPQSLSPEFAIPSTDDIATEASTPAQVSDMETMPPEEPLPTAPAEMVPEATPEVMQGQPGESSGAMPGFMPGGPAEGSAVDSVDSGLTPNNLAQDGAQGAMPVAAPEAPQTTETAVPLSPEQEEAEAMQILNQAANVGSTGGEPESALPQFGSGAAFGPENVSNEQLSAMTDPFAAPVSLTPEPVVASESVATSEPTVPPEPPAPMPDFSTPDMSMPPEAGLNAVADEPNIATPEAEMTMPDVALASSPTEMPAAAAPVDAAPREFNIPVTDGAAPSAPPPAASSEFQIPGAAAA